MRFQLSTILWAFALLASAMATFGLLGIFIAFFVIWFWFLVYKQSQVTLIQLLITIGFLGTMVGLLLPPHGTARRSSGQRCRKNLEKLGRAIALYDVENKGLPMKHWRILLLPYVGRAGSSILSGQGTQTPDEKSSPALSSIAPSGYICSADHNSIKHGTSYFAVVDSRCAWRGTIGNKLANIKDNPSHTILVLEAHNQGIAWTESKDLSFDKALELLSHPAAQPQSCHWREGGFLEKPTWVRNVLFADGAVRTLNMPLSKKLAVALLTATGGETVDMEELDRASRPELDYKKIYALTLFALLSLLPAANLRRHRKQQAATPNLR